MAGNIIRPVGALLAAGGVCTDVFFQLRRDPRIDPVAICITRACEADAVSTEKLPFIPLTCPDDIAAYLQGHGINEVLLAGDLGVLREAPSQFKFGGSDYTPDAEMAALLDKKSTIYAQLKVMEEKLRQAEIKPLHVKDFIADLGIEPGWIGGKPICAMRQKAIDKIQGHLRELRLSGNLEKSSRTTLVFDDLRLLASNVENTQLTVELAGSTPAIGKESVRTIVKMSTDHDGVTLAAPTFCNEDIMHCGSHGIDLVILDSEYTIFAEREASLASAERFGISVLGMSFS